MPDTISDTTLIQLTLQGRQASYAALVDRYQAYVFTIVLRHVNNREQAEELAQDVFVKAYKSLADFKGSSKFSTWLYTIAHHTCLSALRKRDAQHILPGDEKMHVLTAANPTLQPATQLEQKTENQQLEKAIASLPETDAAIITLFYNADQSIDEIGQIMGITPANVKVRLFRARSKLKTILSNDKVLV